MIVLKHNGCVYMAVAAGNIESNAKENRLIWHTDKGQALVGVLGSTRLADAIRYEKIIPGEFNKNGIVLYTTKLIQMIAERYDLINDDRCLNAEIFFAKGDKAYQMISNGSVYEIENVYSEHFDMVMGLYEAEEISDPESFLKEAASLIEKTTGDVQFPLIIANTKSKKVKIITRETL